MSHNGTPLGLMLRSPFFLPRCHLAALIQQIWWYVGIKAKPKDSHICYCKIYLMMPIVTKRSREDVPHVPQHFRPESNRTPSWWWGGSPVSLALPFSKGCDSSRGSDIMHGKYSAYSAIMSIVTFIWEKIRLLSFPRFSTQSYTYYVYQSKSDIANDLATVWKHSSFMIFFVCILQLPQQCDFDTRCGRGKCEKQDWRHTSKVHRLGI